MRVAHLVHGLELPGRVDVQQREGRLGRIEGLGRQVQHHRAVLADRVEHHRAFALGDHLSHDVDALGFQTLQMGEHGFRKTSKAEAVT
jgi:L-fucose isomerase-like protein